MTTRLGLSLLILGHLVAAGCQTSVEEQPTPTSLAQPAPMNDASLADSPDSMAKRILFVAPDPPTPGDGGRHTFICDRTRRVRSLKTGRRGSSLARAI